jgi:alanine racemase
MNQLSYTISEISYLLQAKATLVEPDRVIRHLLTDSRTVQDPETTLFFALKAQRDGHSFIAHAYQIGVRNFVVSSEVQQSNFPAANFLYVANVTSALQSIALWHRKAFNIPIIGITGSNGKTVVKEWLYQMLAADYAIVRSPKSFNSQIGVPLAVWQINANHQLGIFEAGISKVDEMEHLASIIQPSIGILTNIGEAHAEGFANQAQKLIEKLKLFAGADLFIYAPEYVSELTNLPGKRHFTWSRKHDADLKIATISKRDNQTQITANYLNEIVSCTIPFSDSAAIENAIICWATLLAMGYEHKVVAERLSSLNAVQMRLALINGKNNCSIIDDSYSADISSLAIALDFLKLQNQHPQRTLILSDLVETGKSDEVLYQQIADLLLQKGVNKLIGIGEHISAFSGLFDMECVFFKNTADCIASLANLRLVNETILIKGARKFQFERLTKLLTQKTHDTVLEINLNALSSNLEYYRSKITPGVKIMAMVKAFSYGSGSYEIANLLQHHKVDYLTVAYADEGIALRTAGITLPIMVMSPESSAFEAMLKYQLEPEIYNQKLLKQFIDFLPAETLGFPIHIKLDTGMHRLGFERGAIAGLIIDLKESKKVNVKSVFTHLVASGEVLHEDFTLLQLDKFNQMYNALSEALTYKPIKHALNTAGITKFPNYQMDMVRVGIGLYGHDSALASPHDLSTVAVLKTTVSQVKQLNPGETVGYSRNGILPNGGQIATVKIGYADGYARSFGNGVGQMLVSGVLVPTIGSICMDMCMLDVTGLAVEEGDEVIVFNEQHTIEILAKQANTIPYEILTSISQRVKRIYFYE